MSARYSKKTPKRGGVFRVMLIFILGFSGGLGSAAGVTYYVNKLPIPFAASPTQDSASTPKRGRDRSQRDALEFHNILKDRKAVPLEDGAATESSARQFVYYLQLGAFAEPESAEELRGQLALAGYTARIKTATTAGGGDLFRVWLGPHELESAAEELRGQLALAGYNNASLLKIAAP